MLDEMYDYWVKDFDAETSKTEQGGFSGENGELIIACEGGYEPFSYVNEEGDCGYDVDFMYRFCREYGYTPNIQRVAFESIAPGAESGKYDIGLNIILSDERRRECLPVGRVLHLRYFHGGTGRKRREARFLRAHEG